MTYLQVSDEKCSYSNKHRLLSCLSVLSPDLHKYNKTRKNSHISPWIIFCKLLLNTSPWLVQKVSKMRRARSSSVSCFRLPVLGFLFFLTCGVRHSFLLHDRYHHILGLDSCAKKEEWDIREKLMRNYNTPHSSPYSEVDYVIMIIGAITFIISHCHDIEEI